MVIAECHHPFSLESLKWSFADDCGNLSFNSSPLSEEAVGRVCVCPSVAPGDWRLLCADLETVALYCHVIGHMYTLYMCYR